MKKKTVILEGVSLLALMTTSCQQSASTKRTNLPNVIYIMADDLGYGDLGCFGSTKIKTPHIDALAKQGMLFTDHYAGCTVSAPSRSVLMTGLHMGHTPIRGNRELDVEGQFPMSAESFTIAELFKTKGYVTGAFGKWGLGYPTSEGDPNHQGFDEFWGYNCQRQAHRYYPAHIWHNQEKFPLKGNDTKHTVTYAPDVIHQEAMNFLKENKDKPFFMYVPIVQPHAELIAPDDEILAQYKGAFPEKPYINKSKTADYGSPNFKVTSYCSQPMPHATFAAMVTRIDAYVGDIMLALKKYGLEENTLIIFTSDNGPHLEGGADPRFFNSNGPLRGFKRDLTDGGIRVPMIARWKGTIKPNSTSHLVSAFWDMMPTFAAMIDAKVEHPVDGISMLPTFLGESDKQEKHDFLYWEFSSCGGSKALRMGNWKVLQRGLNKNPQAPLELYNLSNDIEEKQNVADQHPELIKKAKEIMKREHVYNANYPFPFEASQH